MKIESGDTIYIFNRNLNRFLGRKKNPDNTVLEVKFTTKKGNAYPFRFELAQLGKNDFSDHFSNSMHDTLSNWQSQSFNLFFGDDHHLSVLLPKIETLMDTYQNVLEDNLIGKHSFRFALKPNLKRQEMNTKFYIKDSLENHNRDDSGVLFFEKSALYEANSDTLLNVYVKNPELVPFITRPLDGTANTRDEFLSWMFIPEKYYEEGIINCVEKKTFEHRFPTTQAIFKTETECNDNLHINMNKLIGKK